MSQDLVAAPTARTWRDIPQPVKPRAMSSGGRRRLATATLRVAGGVALAVALAWGGVMVVGALQENSKAMPAAARAVPVRPPELLTDGVLDARWLAGVLALPRHASLMELDLQRLRDRVLADGQVLTASLTRHFPDRLIVRVTERVPVARLMTEVAGERQAVVVARDGVVFAGVGYDDALLRSLPWLDGVTLVRRGGKFEPVAGMATVSDLLSKAQLEAEHLYRTWHVVSLARLATDREIEVRTRAPQELTIIFGADEGEERVRRDLSFFQQLARLNYLCEQLAAQPVPRARIDLSLGSRVPVTFPEAAPARPAVTGSQPSGKPLFSLSPSDPTKT